MGKNNPEIQKLVEFARIAERFLDGKRLPLRFNHAFGISPAFSEADFLELSNLVKKRWEQGKILNIELF